jgi:uncharacterized membrane protein YfcA
LAGVCCFTAAAFSLPLSTDRSWRFRAYLISLVGLVVFLAAAVGVDWSSIDRTARIVYAALFVLALYMMFRAAQAVRRLRQHGDNWRRRYLDDIGFTLISLFDGFVIVGAIDLGAPGWLVAAIGVAGVAAGILTIRQIQARLGPGIG